VTVESTYTSTLWVSPESPMDYGPGRRCTMDEKCKSIPRVGEVGKVNRYTKPYQIDDDGRATILFCGSCERDRILADEDPNEYQGVPVPSRQPEGFRKHAYPLPSLKYHRKRLGFTQREVALMAGCGRDTVKGVERGKRKASPEMAEKLAHALGVSIEALREEE
jgi:DNA-binding XRE family transcriptional regulator